MSSDRRLPDPPDPSTLDPLLETWARGERIVRCHKSVFGATEYNPGLGRGRFHPFEPFEKAGGAGVPTVYGSSSLDGALSETVFHDLPIRGPGRSVLRSSLKTMLVSVLAPLRDLKLVQLHGYGFRRLEISRAELIESDAQYSQTVGWARALHACESRIDGLVWVSRQHDTSLALVLFGDRVKRADLEVVDPPLPLYLGPGFDEVQRAAEQAGITVVE